MNGRLILLCLKSMLRRWKRVLRTIVTVFIAFLFVAGMLLFQENMYQYQTAVAKKHFGDWFIMNPYYNAKKDNVLGEHIYLEKPKLAYVVNSIYDYDKETDEKIGFFTQDFIQAGNIKLDKGEWAQNDDEVAVDWNTLLKLNQGYEIGDTISIHTYTGPTTDKENEVTKTYRLSGIINSYTNIWQGGENLPGIILTENECENIKHSNDIKQKNIAIYGIKNIIQESDYEAMFNKMQKDTDREMVFNSSVYAYKPWGNELVYNYIFILVMLVGIAAITYQMMAYNMTRKYTMDIHIREGAARGQITGMYMCENFIILLLSSFLGLFTACQLARLICSAIGKNMGVTFFYIGSSTYIKMLITLILSVIISIIFNVYMNISHVINKSVKIKIGKNHNDNAERYVPSNNKKINGKEINNRNFIYQTHIRFMHTNGFLPNMFIRIFALVMAAVMVLCAINMHTAYKAYEKNADKDDIVAYKKENNTSAYVYYYNEDINEYKEEVQKRKESASKYATTDYKEPTELEIYNKFRINISSYQDYLDNADTEYIFGIDRKLTLNNNLKCADTYIYKGIDENTLKAIKDIDGVEEVHLGYFETGRSWYWDGMDYNKIGADDYISDSDGKLDEKNYKYLYASEYVEPDSSIYDIICKYAGDNAPDYEKWAAGELSVVFKDTNIRGQYDDTLQPGMTLNLYGYADNMRNDQFVYHQWDGSESEYSDALIRYYMDNVWEKYVNVKDDPDTADVIANHKTWSWNRAHKYVSNKLSFDRLEELNLISRTCLSGSNVESQTKTTQERRERYDEGVISEEAYRGFLGKYANTELERRYRYKTRYTPAADTNVAAVIYITDENRDEINAAFKEYIPEFGQFTLISTTTLLQEALDNQNENIKQYFLLDELPDELTLKLKYNQVNIRYGIDSALVSTGNIVSSYLGQSGFSYKSYSEEKDLLKQKTIETMMLYGISLLAAVFVVIAVSVLIVKNRCEKYESRLRIIKRTGAKDTVLVRICMLECVRKAIWCPFVAVIVILLDWITITLHIRDIK